MRKLNIGAQGISLIFALASCQKPGANASTDPESINLEGARVELQHRVEIARLKADRIERLHHQDLAPIQALTEQKSRHRELSAKKEALVAEIQSIEDEALTAKATQLEAARANMTGREFPELQTQDGRTYDQVKIVSINDSGIQIRHSSGSARLGYADLSEKQRVQFGLDEDLAAAAIAAESAQLLAYERRIDQELAASPKEPQTAAVPKSDRRLQPSSPQPTTTAFDRRVSLGSSSDGMNRVVARYRTQRRSSSYYYTWNPYSYSDNSYYQPVRPTYRQPVPAKAMGVEWPSGTPVYPKTNPTPTP